MTQQIINIGALPNDGTGDPLRTAFEKINNNFTQLFSTAFATVESYSVGNTAGQILFETPANTFTQAKFQINSANPGTQDSQNITITAAKTNNGSNVRYNGYSTLFNGSAVCSYSMDVAGGNIRLKCDPLTSATLVHFISYQVSWVGPDAPGIPLELDGYPAGTLMTTENNLELATEQ